MADDSNNSVPTLFGVDPPSLYGSRVREGLVATLQDGRKSPSHGERVVQENGVSLIAERRL